MRATITYLLSEQGQREKMAAIGQPVARKQTLEVEVPVDQIGFFDVNENGELYLDLSTDAPAYLIPRAAGRILEALGGKYFPSEPTVEFLESVLAAAGAKREEKKRAEERKVDVERRYREAVLAAWKADLSAARHRSEPDSVYEQFRAELDAVESYRSISRYETTPEWLEIKSAIQAEDDAAKAAEEAKEAAKTAFIDAWIAEHAEPDIRQQHEDGLLARKFAVDLIAAAALDACLPAAVPVHETCDNRQCKCGSATVKSIPPRLYPAWREIRTKLPADYEVTFEARRDHVEHDPEDSWSEEAPVSWGKKYWVAEVTIPHGPFRFTRTVMLG